MIQTQATLSSSQTVTSSSPTITSSPLTPSHVVIRSSLTPSPSPLTRYAEYLKAVYHSTPLATRDKLPYFRGKVFIKLALILKEDVTREQADHFTRLTLQGEIDTILKAKQPITMEDVLKDNDTRLVVVEGAPGIGKSTLAWELCRQWPTLESLKRFSLVVLLRLREEGVQTATAISDLFPCLDEPSLGRCVGEEVGRRKGEGVLLVFDGFDEFPAELRRKSLVAEMINGSYLPKASVLVTSRLSATAELLSLCQAHVGKRIEIVGFSGKEIQEYAESIFGRGSQLLASFQTYLSVNPLVRGMMYNPLNCGMVVEVYRESYKSNRPIPRTQTQLYTELSLCLLSRHLSAAKDPLVKRLPNDIYRLEDIEKKDRYLYQQLRRLGRLAFEGRVREEVIFKELPEGCNTLGLLNTCSELYGWRDNVTYNFLHLTLQEYLSAFYISQLPASEQRKLFVEHCKLGHLNVVWRFVAGLTRMQAIGWEGVRGGKVKEEGRGYMYVVNEDRGYVVGDGVVRVWPSVVQYLYEAQDAGSCASVFGQSRVEYCGQWCSTPFDAYAVGYCVSLCRNDWNVDLRGNGLGSEVVEMLVCGLKSVQYGGGSVRELRLYHNPITDEGMRFLQLFPYQIFQQMRTLNLSFCCLRQEGFDLLADTVPLLSSLESLHISGNPGGNGSTVKLLQALGKHQRVEHLAMEYTVIGRDDVMVLSEVVQPSGSLRELDIGGDKDMSPECVQQLVRMVLSPSSLKTVEVWVPSSVSPLCYIETISDSLTRLVFWSPWGPSSEQLPTELSCSKLSKILKENTTLKELVLIPLGNTEARAIVESLKHNCTLTELWLSRRYHSQYFSESERQVLDHRIKWW